MKSGIRLLCGLFVLGFSSATPAIPTLQLNIEGGFYDNSTETIVTPSDLFTLDAFAWVNKFELTNDEPVYLSVAITPRQEETDPDPDIGSFKVDGTSYSIGDLIYGVPPVENAEAIFDGGDMPKHDIYETYFLELEFFFDANTTVFAFNTQDDAGKTPDPVTDPGNTDDKDEMYMVQFDIDASGLLGDFGLHFDLYNTHVKNSNNCPDPQDCDFDVDDFAPFSHDAGTVTVPEPVTLGLLGLGLAGLGLTQRRRSRHTS